MLRHHLVAGLCPSAQGQTLHEAFTCTGDKILGLPNEDKTLLKDVKLTGPMAEAFDEYWNTYRIELVLTLVLTDAEAQHHHAIGVSEEELFSGAAPSASVGGVERST